MQRGGPFELRTAFDHWTIERPRVCHAPKNLQLVRAFIADVSFHVESAAPGGLELLCLLLSVDPVSSDAVGRQPSLDVGTRRLLLELERDLLMGMLRVLRRIPHTGTRSPKVIPPAPRSPPAPRETNDTFFDVRYVDETGQPLNGILIDFAAGGGDHEVKTNAGGVALLEHVTASSASAVASEVAPLEKILDGRWAKFRPQKAPRVSNMVSFPFEGTPHPPVPLKAAVPHTVVLTPPVGLLFAELWDKTGRVRHAAQEYSIDGPMQFSGKTDDDGRLRHEAVFPGDYVLKLTVAVLEGQERQEDEYESPLVVLAPTETSPEVRMIGSVPLVVLARLRGGFETNKSFLLPAFVMNLQRLHALYAHNEPAELLIVGHCDTTGESGVNDPLSLERADMTRAFLEDDVDTWLGRYDTTVAAKTRWGGHEDLLMVESLPDFRTKGPSEDSVRWFQRTRALEVDGIAGPDTRRALITEYMSRDHTSLKLPREFDVAVTIHGCGENFPANDEDEVDAAPADGAESARSRRVELFFFDREFGIRPPPPGKNSGKGATEYPKWREAAVLSHDLDADHEEGLVVEWSDAISDGLPGDLVLEATQEQTKEAIAWAMGSVEDGFRRFVFSSITGGSTVRLVARSSERSQRLVLWQDQLTNDPEAPPVWSHVLEEMTLEVEPDGSIEIGDVVPDTSDAPFRAIGKNDLFDL